MKNEGKRLQTSGCASQLGSGERVTKEENHHSPRHQLNDERLGNPEFRRATRKRDHKTAKEDGGSERMFRNLC